MATTQRDVRQADHIIDLMRRTAHAVKALQEEHELAQPYLDELGKISKRLEEDHSLMERLRLRIVEDLPMFPEK